MRGIKESGRIFADPDVRVHARARRRSSSIGLDRSRSSATSTRCRSTPKLFDGEHRSSAGRSASSSCSRASRRARSRSPASRRSRTACPRSAARSRRTPPPRSCGWASLLGTLFFGVSMLAHHLQPYPSHDRTVIAQLGPRGVRQRPDVRAPAVRDRRDPRRSPPTPRTTASRACRRSSPRTATCPRQLANRGDRLVFSNGIIVLAAAAALPARRVRRHHQRADPALRGRRVHVVHAVAVGHGAPPPQAAGDRAGSATWCSTRSARSPRSSCCSSSRSPSSRAGPGSRSS